MKEIPEVSAQAGDVFRDRELQKNLPPILTSNAPSSTKQKQKRYPTTAKFTATTRRFSSVAEVRKAAKKALRKLQRSRSGRRGRAARRALKRRWRKRVREARLGAHSCIPPPGATDERPAKRPAPCCTHHLGPLPTHGPVCFECGGPAIPVPRARSYDMHATAAASSDGSCADHDDAMDNDDAHPPLAALEPSTDLTECRFCSRLFHGACRRKLCLLPGSPFPQELCGACIEAVCGDAAALGRSEPRPPVHVHTSVRDIPHTVESASIEALLTDRLASTTARATCRPLSEHVHGLAVRCLCDGTAEESIALCLMQAYPGLALPPIEDRSVPYRRLVFGLFQEATALDGRHVTVLLFAIVVQEFCGEAVPLRFRGTAYLDFMEGVPFLTAAGLDHAATSAARTAVFQATLHAYLLDAMHRGLQSLFLWACPPAPGGMSYLLFRCLPTTRNGRAVSDAVVKERLRGWYGGLFKTLWDTGTAVVEALSELAERRCAAGVASLHGLPPFARGTVMFDEMKDALLAPGAGAKDDEDAVEAVLEAFADCDPDAAETDWREDCHLLHLQPPLARLDAPLRALADKAYAAVDPDRTTGAVDVVITEHFEPHEADEEAQHGAARRRTLTECADTAVEEGFMPLRELADVEDWFELCTLHGLRWDTAEHAAHATQQLLLWLALAATERPVPANA